MKFSTGNFRTDFSDWRLRLLSLNCPNMNVTGLACICFYASGASIWDTTFICRYRMFHRPIFFIICTTFKRLRFFSIPSFPNMIRALSTTHEGEVLHDDVMTWKLFHTTGGHFKNTYELWNLRALKFSLGNKIHIFRCMGKIFCVEFQRYPLKFHNKTSYPYIERYDFYTTLKF